MCVCKAPPLFPAPVFPTHLGKGGQRGGEREKRGSLCGPLPTPGAPGAACITVQRITAEPSHVRPLPIPFSSLPSSLFFSSLLSSLPFSSPLLSSPHLSSLQFCLVSPLLVPPLIMSCPPRFSFLLFSPLLVSSFPPLQPLHPRSTEQPTQTGQHHGTQHTTNPPARAEASGTPVQRHPTPAASPGLTASTTHPCPSSLYPS